MSRVKAFQTLDDNDNVDEIEDHGPYKCERSNAWLGFGYYFWDTNIEWAHNWGRLSYQNNYVICEAQIDLNERCFDLVGSIECQLEFKEIIKEFKESGFLSDKGNVYIGEVINLMKTKDIFDYDLIRANDNNKNSITYLFTSNNNENTTLLKRTQICLINKSNLISQTFKVIYPDHYREDY